MKTSSKLTIVTMFLLLLGFGLHVSAQPMGRGPGMGPGMMGQAPVERHEQRGAEEYWEHMGPWMMGQGAGPGGLMGPGMMGSGMMGFGMGPGAMMGGPGMGMMAGVMHSPELAGTMMLIHGDMLNLMGRMVEKYGGAAGQMTAEQRDAMRKDMMQGMGEILARHGAALQEKAKATGK